MRESGRRGRARPGRAGLGVAALAMVATVAAGCSSGGGDDLMSGSAEDASGGSSAAVAQKRDVSSPTGPGGTSADRTDVSSAAPRNRSSVQSRAVIRRGEVSLVAKEMNRARTEVDDLLGRYGGLLASEDTENDEDGRPQRSVLVLRVPEPAFEDAMGDLQKIGRPQHAERSSEDVTTEVIDVDTRVATQEASLARLQRFLRQAVDVEDMIRLESEIAKRQADLESMKAQQSYLRDQTTMSTITVRLRTPDTPPQAPEEDAGFLAGLGTGWAALKAVLVGAATVAGALLPFAVTLALLGVPTWLLVRALRRRRTAPPAPTTTPTPDSP